MKILEEISEAPLGPLQQNLNEVVQTFRYTERLAEVQFRKQTFDLVPICTQILLKNSHNNNSHNKLQFIFMLSNSLQQNRQAGDVVSDFSFHNQRLKIRFRDFKRIS